PGTTCYVSRAGAVSLVERAWKRAFRIESQTQFDPQRSPRRCQILSRAGRLEPVRTCEHSRVIGRDEAAGFAGARSGAESARATDGRTLCRARCFNPGAVLRRYPGDLESTPKNDCVRYP